MDPELQALGLQLAEASIKNTARAVSERITAIKAKKRDQETIAELEQIVGDLITDKSEALRIAQAFQEELVAQRLSDEDVEYVTGQLFPVLAKLFESGVVGSADTTQLMEVMKPLLSKETVTILQLLGFNFRKAIGQPLTELVSHAILTNAKPDGHAAAELQVLAAQREVLYLEVSKDAEAYARLREFFPKSDSSEAT